MSIRSRRPGEVPPTPTDTSTTRPRFEFLPAWRADSPQLRRDRGYTDTAVYVSQARLVSVDQWADDTRHVTLEVYTGTNHAAQTMTVSDALKMADAVIARFRLAPAPR